MNIVESDRVVWCDVDDTLVNWDLSNFPASERITINHVNGPVKVVPHKKNINTLMKFWKLGYTFVVHSGSGHKWAKAVVDALGLTDKVHTCMSKPLYYFDDKPVETWAGPRIWRDPRSGSEFEKNCYAELDSERTEADIDPGYLRRPSRRPQKQRAPRRKGKNQSAHRKQRQSPAAS